MPDPLVPEDNTPQVPEDSTPVPTYSSKHAQIGTTADLEVEAADWDHKSGAALKDLSTPQGAQGRTR